MEGRPIWNLEETRKNKRLRTEKMKMNFLDNKMTIIPFSSQEIVAFQKGVMVMRFERRSGGYDILVWSLEFCFLTLVLGDPSRVQNETLKPKFVLFSK